MLVFDNDDTLIRRALKGSSVAWEKLTRRHERRIYNKALRLTGNREDALDLTQEVFLALFRNLDQYRNDGNFGAWLSRITTNRTIDFLRRRNPAEPNPEHTTIEQLEHARGNPHYGLAQREANEAIMNVLAKLPNEQRIVVEFKFFEQMTFDEMADHLGISPNTAKSRLYNALKKLKPHLEAIHAM